MDLVRSLTLAAAGLKAQASRMRVISENIANADSTASKPGGDPYQRKISMFRTVLDRNSESVSVQFAGITRDTKAFETRIEPGNPAADAKGVVKLPNVDLLVEQMDMREAQRSYEANLNVIAATRRMLSQTIGMLRA